MSFNSVKKVSQYAKGYKGTVADGAPKYARSYSVELTASQDIADGAPLLRGTAPGTQARPTVVGDVISYSNFAGFKLNDPTKEAVDTGQQYADEDLVSVLVFGVMNASASSATIAGQGVVVQVNGGSLSSALMSGALGTGEFFLPMCTWEDSVAQGGVGRLSIGMRLSHQEITGSSN